MEQILSSCNSNVKRGFEVTLTEKNENVTQRYYRTVVTYWKAEISRE